VVDVVSVKDVTTGRVVSKTVVLASSGNSVVKMVVVIVDILVRVAALRVTLFPLTIVVTTLVE
jgi:hypothetical protein